MFGVLTTASPLVENTLRMSEVYIRLIFNYLRLHDVIDLLFFVHFSAKSMVFVVKCTWVYSL